MKKLLILLILTTVILSSCSSSESSIATAVAETLAFQSEKAIPRIEPTLVTTPAIVPTNTDVPPTSTILPTATNTSSPAVTSPESKFAWNFLGEQESGGVKVEIGRVLIAEKSAIDQDFSKDGKDTTFDNRLILAEIIFIVSNNTDKVISIYPDQGKVIASGEQVDLVDFLWAGTNIGDNVSGEIYPGVTVIGGLWFGFKRISLSDIQEMTIVFDAPTDENYNTLGTDFKFVLDLSDRKFEPLPEEFK